MKQEIPPYVVEANAQRDLYYSETRFKNARELVVASGFEDVIAAQDKQLADFLSGRKVKHDATLEQLVKIQEPQAVLLGATFYFSRKFFTTSHDCGDDIQNPVPSIQNVFDAIAASDDRHAAKVLEELGELSGKDSPNQRKIVAVITDVMPEFIREYATHLRNLESRHRPGSAMYNTEKSKIDQKQMALLDKVIEYTKHAIRTYQEPSLSNFRKYAGIDKANGNGESKGMRQITISYIQELLGSHKIDYVAAIRQLEQEAGALLIVNNHRERNGSGIKLTIGAGSTASPRSNQLVYNRDHRGSDATYRMLLAICDHITGKNDIPPESRTTTSLARRSIVSYQERG